MHNLEFRNFNLNADEVKHVSADLYINEKFVINLSGDLDMILASEYNELGILKYFKQVVWYHVHGVASNDNITGVN